ncbi:hypothetical protein ElyMa_004225300 [Elysia marginata]|uniref:Uncharacterized protein n=1 Tax=Elysia marginata TaxID=1093978 RepID=A0AAV4GP27_9GAST|nr:hypothetical protein ElyMa_004225300 [Elysia marginata]
MVMNKQLMISLSRLRDINNVTSRSLEDWALVKAQHPRQMCRVLVTRVLMTVRPRQTRGVLSVQERLGMAGWVQSGCPLTQQTDHCALTTVKDWRPSVDHFTVRTSQLHRPTLP